MHVTTGEMTVRVASRSDRLAICTLLQQAWHSAGGARWDQLDALEAGCAALVARRGSAAIAFCLLELRTAPVARLSAVAIADREEVGAVWHGLWSAAAQYLARQSIRFAYYAGEAPWLLEALAGHGFKQVNTLVGYERTQGAPPVAGHSGVRLRPARSSDLATVAEIDAASFPLLWRYPRPILEAAMQSPSRFTVAETDRRLVGYELSAQEGGEGQIIRLAVLPEYRRQGIGSRLLADALNHLRRGRIRRVSLNTQGDNLPAQKLYEQFGFQRTGEELPVLEKALER